MTQEQKRIAILEACGWEEVRLSTQQEHHLKSYHQIVIGRPRGSVSNTKVAPNHFSDLNAMHDAEKVLTKEQRRKYVRTLFQTTNTDWDSHCATASQRARAFLETLMLWGETK